MGRIDTHHHYVPPKYAALLRERGLTPGGIPVPSWSMEIAGKVLRKVGVDTAVLSLSTPGVWFGDAAEAAYWARHVNDYAAEVVERSPRQFGFFATLTLPDVDGAIREATHALDVLKADGIVLLANNAGLYLGDPSFDRLLAFLGERRAVVFVHPGELPAEPVPEIPTFAADFLLDTTRTTISLILTGQLERHPNITWLLAHAGGFVPYIAHRIVLATLKDEPKLKLAKLALNAHKALAERLALVKRFWFDVALSSTPTAMPSLLAAADPTRIVFGTDFPFAPAPAVKLMEREYRKVDLSPDLRHAIDRGNAERLFPRLTATAPSPTSPLPRH